MEEPPLLQSLIVSPSETTAYSYPPPRRRPISSRTFGALIRIFSHCRPQPLQQEIVCEENGSIIHSQILTEVIVPHPNSTGSQDKIVREASDAKTKENNNSKDFDDISHATTPKFHQPELVTDSEKELISSNEISIDDYLVVEEKADGLASQNAKEVENVNNVLGMKMDDFGTLKYVELDKDSCFDQLNEVIDSCFGFDMVVESSKGGQLSQEKDTVSEEKTSKVVEYELQMKEVELEKLIYSSSNREASFFQNGGDIEEGEISGDAGIADKLFGASPECAIHGEEITENPHSYEGDSDRDNVLCDDKGRGLQHQRMTDPSLVSIVNIESNYKNVKDRLPARKLQEYHDLEFLRGSGSHMKTPKSGDTLHRVDNSTPPRRMVQAIAAENQISMTTGMDQMAEDASTKKRKRIVTKERKAKKKKKERLKRAKKNREDGVKRLKLPTIVKPKQIVYCRHYLQGRCHEGEKCKFSHDTVPLTKSKPCGHFARHSCMKGDDCPFDHQLSKYPCNNFASNGFCNRGSDCMFSHEIPAKSPSVSASVSKHDLISPQQTVPEKEGSRPVLKVNKSELKSPSPMRNTNSSRPIDSCGKVNNRLCSAANTTAQREQLASKPVPGTGLRAPRGVSFLLNGVVPLGDTNSDKWNVSTAETTDGLGGGCKGTHTVPGATRESNEIITGVTPRKPRGINFLSFGQPPSDVSSSKILSESLSNCNDGTGKSLIDDAGNGKVSSSVAQGAGTFNANRQMKKSAIDVKSNGTVVAVPQNVNFLSFGGNHSDVSTSKGEANLHSGKGDNALSSTKDDAIGTPSPSLRRQYANLMSNSVKAAQSTLAFAAQLEPHITVGLSHRQRIS